MIRTYATMVWLEILSSTGIETPFSFTGGPISNAQRSEAHVSKSVASAMC